MKNTFTTVLATISTAVPEVTAEIEKFDPTVITETSSLLVQVVTAIIALISFFKGWKKKPKVEEITYKNQE